MGAYKQFLTSDIIITPFEVNKSFTFQGASELTASVVSIDRFLGLNTSSLFNPTTDPKTGQVSGSTQYQRLIYNSIKELFYSNYLSSSYGDPANVGFIVPGNDDAGNVVEVLDALCDITYVSLGNGAMLHGLKDKILPAYAEVQASNMSKACKTKRF